MKKLHTGVILLDVWDVILICFSVGSTLAYLNRKYQQRRSLDPIVTELKAQSAVIGISTDGKPLKLPLFRGGQTLNGVSLAIKSKRLAALIRAIIHARKSQKLFKLLQINFAILNALLTSSVGLRFAVGGSFGYTQFILISVPATASGFLVGQAIANPLASIFLPVAILYGRGIQNVPDPYEKCRLLCKFAEQYHNQELKLEMKTLNSALGDAATAIQLPLDPVPLVCVEEKLSLLQRFKLKQVIKSAKAKKQVQYFSQFIKQFSECDVDPETVYQQVVGKITD